MPTSSTSRHSTSSRSSTAAKRSYWPNQNQTKTKDPIDLPVKSKLTSFQKRITGSSNNNNTKNHQSTKYNQIRHISPPSSLTSTSAALRNSIMTDRAARQQSHQQQDGASDNLPSPHPSGPASAFAEAASMSLAGQLVLTGGVGGKQPASLSSLAAADSDYLANKATNNSSGGKLNFLSSNAQYAHSAAIQQSPSQTSLVQHQHHQHQHQPTISTNSSTAHLNSLNNLTSGCQSAASLSIRRQVNLKYVKSLIILLLAIDLLITVFVHQFSSQDQLSIWFITSFKLRFSLLNLVLSSIWFVVLIGGILFDVYSILFLSCLIDLASFVLLLIFSIIHFSRRIDYNTVNLTSLLALLFSVIVLHVYLIVMATLTIYLMQAVKRRQRSPSSR